MNQRLRSSLTIWVYFTFVGLSLFGYRYLESVASREVRSPREPFIDEVLTGAWMAAILFPFVARFSRRYPIVRPHRVSRVSLHIVALLIYSLLHTTLLWG